MFVVQSLIFIERLEDTGRENNHVEVLNDLLSITNWLYYKSDQSTLINGLLIYFCLGLIEL